MKFYYYNSMQKGSASIKKVLPAVTGKDYSGLEISDGMTASIKFLTANFGDSSDSEVKKVRDDLEKYCGLDTEGMVWIVEKMRGMV